MRRCLTAAIINVSNGFDTMVLRQFLTESLFISFTFHCGSGLWSGCLATKFFRKSEFFRTIRANLRFKQSLPARSQKRSEAPISRVRKRVLRFGIERAPSLVGVRALDNQATPAAFSSVSIIQIYHGVSQLNDIHEKPKCHILMYMIIVKKKKKKKKKKKRN